MNVYYKFSRAEAREYIIACSFIPLAFLHYALETCNVSFEDMALFEAHSFTRKYNCLITHFFKF